jgi:hypothetical protein
MSSTMSTVPSMNRPCRQVQRLGQLVDGGFVTQHELQDRVIPDDGVVHDMAVCTDCRQQVSGRGVAVEGRPEAQRHGLGVGALAAEANGERDFTPGHGVQVLRVSAGADLRHWLFPSGQPRAKR